MQRVLSVCLLTALAPMAAAQDLGVGDAAPALHVAKWLKGEPIAEFAPGKIYVVEFWATWCGPCIASMPHLSELQRAHREHGVTIVGITTEDPNNSLAQAEAMVADKGDGMDYTVAWDDGGKTNAAWMKAAERRGIPCSFVVDQHGKLAYIGHPMFLDLPLDGLLAGTWDAVAGTKKIDGAFQRMGKMTLEIGKAEDHGDAAVAAFLADFPMLAAAVEKTRFRALLQHGKFDPAYRAARVVVADAVAKKDPSGLNEVAWTIVDPEAEIAQRDLDLALEAASKAVELSKAKDGAILDTLARVWFWKKDYSKALELQKKAVAASPREDLQAALKEYEALVAEHGGQ
ncbi:MAG: redoxin family protein [Planctomycetota bacterium]